MVADEIGPRHHLDAVQSIRRVEHAVMQHPVQVEIRPQGCSVDVETFRTDPFGVVGPVPGREFDTVPGGDVRQERRLRVGVGDGRPHQVGQELVDGGAGLHRLVGHLGIGMRGETEQPCPLGAQCGHLENERTVVVLARIGPVGGRLEQPLPDVPVAQRRQQRLPGRQDQGERVLTVVPPRGRGVGRGGDGRGAQPIEFGRRIQEDDGILGGLQQVLLERRGQGRQLAVQLAQPGPTVVVESGAGQHEIEVVAPNQHRLFGVRRGVGVLR